MLVDKDYKWCVQFNKLQERSMSWKPGEPSHKGDCVYVDIRNTSGTTLVATDNCATPRKFICEV